MALKVVLAGRVARPLCSRASTRGRASSVRRGHHSLEGSPLPAKGDQLSTGRCRRFTRRSSLVEPRIGVVGATGEVVPVTVELLRERGYENVRAFAFARSAGKAVGGVRVEEATPETLGAGDLDVLLFRRNGIVARARAAGRAGRRAGSRQVRLPPAGRRPARRPRGEPREDRAARQHRREPELLHDPADDGAEAAARRGRPRVRGQHLPVDVRRGRRAHGRATRDPA
jgi:hypothetical protein